MKFHVYRTGYNKANNAFADGGPERQLVAKVRAKTSDEAIRLTLEWGVTCYNNQYMSAVDSLTIAQERRDRRAKRQAVEIADKHEPHGNDKVFVVLVHHRHGTDTWVCRTGERARQALLAYIAEWWDQEINHDLDPGDKDYLKIPEDENEVIHQYFHNERVQEDYEIQEQEVLA